MSLLDPTVPVTLEDSWGGLAENSGLLRLEGGTVVLECETTDGVVQVLKSGVKRFSLPLAEIEAFTWKRGWFGGKIELSVRSMHALDGIPGAAQGRVVFRVARRDRDKALGLAVNVDLALAHRVVRAADSASQGGISS